MWGICRKANDDDNDDDEDAFGLEAAFISIGLISATEFITLST